MRKVLIRSGQCGNIVDFGNIDRHHSGMLIDFIGIPSYTHRKEYCRWITDAKKEETRLKRLGKAIEMLKKGISTPG